MRWHYRDPLLAWLFAPAYAAHLAEEWFGGFPQWVARIAGEPLPDVAFVVINAVAFAAMLAATRSATLREAHGWMVIAIATIALTNGVWHVLGSLVTGTYSPGLFTGVVVYMPLGQLTLLRAWHQTPQPFFVRGLLWGLGIHTAVFVIAFTIARLT